MLNRLRNNLSLAWTAGPDEKQCLYFLPLDDDKVEWKKIGAGLTMSRGVSNSARRLNRIEIGTVPTADRESVGSESVWRVVAPLQSYGQLDLAYARIVAMSDNFCFEHLLAHLIEQTNKPL